ncbi:hypothetical protein COO60DRAFT_1062578 [Scenedesmus sp. NREL 46B-D3]|nr:hypothetical protein COO60DRAFT_1062578 [Scenedesmus sp. NREL 46B-D3]
MVAVPSLESICIEVTAGHDFWLVQKRHVQYLPEHVANQLLQLVLQRGRLQQPKQLDSFRHCATCLALSGRQLGAHHQMAEWLAYVAGLRWVNRSMECGAVRAYVAGALFKHAAGEGSRRAPCHGKWPCNTEWNGQAAEVPVQRGALRTLGRSRKNKHTCMHRQSAAHHTRSTATQRNRLNNNKPVGHVKAAALQLSRDARQEKQSYPTPSCNAAHASNADTTQNCTVYNTLL